MKRKRCSVEGCKKLEAKGHGVYCKIHANDAGAQAVKCSQIEALTFTKTEAELMVMVQGAKLIENAIANEKLQSEARIRALQAKASELLASRKMKQIEYDKFVIGLAKKYGVDDPKQMAIDPDLCTIRDLTKV